MKFILSVRSFAAALLLCGFIATTSAVTEQPSASPSVPKAPVKSPIVVPTPVAPTAPVKSPPVAPTAPVKSPPVAPTAPVPVVPTAPSTSPNPTGEGPAPCGLLNMSIFCPRECGLFKRLLGIGDC